MLREIRYDFDNYSEVYDFKLKLRNGVCFGFLDAKIKFYSGEDRLLIIQINDENKLSKEDVDDKVTLLTQMLSYLYSGPIYNKESYVGASRRTLEINNLLSKRDTKILNEVENKVKRFNKSYKLFRESLGLLVTAHNNKFNFNKEDAFLYYFKVVEKISKESFIQYIQRHHTKAKIKKNKYELKKIIYKYAINNFDIQLTENILSTKTDLFYKFFKQEFYGSTFAKISLFASRHNVKDVDIDTIYKLVKLRNKLAHGDYISEDKINELLEYCEILATEYFSLYFFNKPYKKIKLASTRFEWEE